MYLQGKYIFYALINIFFKKYFVSIFITFLYAQLVNISLYSYFGPKYFVFNNKNIQREIFCRSREIFVEAGSFDNYKAPTIML